MPDARQRAVLEAIGVDLWRLRGEGRGPRAEDLETRNEERGARTEGLDARAEVATNSSSKLPVAKTCDSAVEVEKCGPASVFPAADGLPADSEIANLEPRSSDLYPRPSALTWEELRTTVSTCQACDLHQGRTQTVFGVGDRQARLMIIGEAPGAEEDRQGEPFVGRAGQLLNAMLEAIGFAREQVYIANIVKCRPPGNRDPHADEAAACQAYLYRQIELIDPALILSVGRVSAHNLLSTEEAVGRLRGRTHRFQPGDVPLIVTYHPAYLLRRPEEKAKAWQDLQAAYRVLQGEG